MSTKNLDLNAIPEMVEQKIISSKEALGMLAEIIERFPQKFYLSKYDDELKSEIYIRLLQKGCYLFDHYKKNYGTFQNYFSSFIKFLIKTIQRQNAKDALKESLYRNLESQEYEKAFDQYIKDEYSYKVLHFKPYFPSEKDNPPFKIQQNASDVLEKIPNCRSGGTKHIANYCKEKNSSEKKIALIIALKSSYYLTEENMEAVSAFCNVSPEELKAAVSSFNQKMKKKISKLKQIKERRDQSFYLHRKYKARMDYCMENQLEVSEAKRLYEYHTKNWKMKNYILQDKCYQVCPTNKNLAELLGVCERQIGYYIKKAKESNFAASIIKEE